ncbi:Uma2 family endonuclease [Dyadobacter sp. CY356]|uniref:Uma2 family endonuclease n=1 Tax=Dyadobacter sp. CY356 TaxID=2906442 RepID=UPI001F2F89E5|nr:Uma2 family endonuclease [Dyadobacter sp. CY356]MCF0056718.1 Uma2 family endonuclease [Dyadobacter sp. CY356]
MSAVTQTIHSEEDYLALEEKSDYKSEYFKGEIFMMAGATPNHNRIKENLSGEIYNSLKKRKSCRSYSSDQRIYIPENSLYSYPDIVVVCGPNQYAEKDKNTIINPAVIIEVLSEGTGSYDRGDKFRFYRDIDSLKEYVLVNSVNVGVEIFRRTEDNHWLLAEDAYQFSNSVTIQSIEATLQLSDLYEGTDNVNEGWASPEE